MQFALSLFFIINIVQLNSVVSRPIETSVVNNQSLVWSNPILDIDLPDPGVLRISDKEFYFVHTGNPHFPVRRSENLILWSEPIDSLPEVPQWSSDSYWAPEIHLVAATPTKYALFYTAREKGTGMLRIGVATSDKPMGPYRDLGHPLISYPDIGVIDPHHFQGFLFFKTDGNAIGQPSVIYAQQFDAGTMQVIGERVELIRNNLAWEAAVVEAPWVIVHNGWYYLFYSANTFTEVYVTGVARSKSLLGPYEKRIEPILKSDVLFVGPGHGSVVQRNGELFFVYHAYHNDGKGGMLPGGRRLMLNRIVWDQYGWPVINH